MTPPGTFGTKATSRPTSTAAAGPSSSYEKNYSTNLEGLKSLVKSHKHEAHEILKIALKVSPQLFGVNSIIKNYRGKIYLHNNCFLNFNNFNKFKLKIITSEWSGHQYLEY